MPEPMEGAPETIEGARFTSEFGRAPGMIPLVRRFVSTFHDEVVRAPRSPRGHPSPRASQLSLAAHELMENAVAHGGEAHFSLHIGPDPDVEGRYAVRMATRNRATAHHRAVVCEMLHALRQAEDRHAFYCERMAESARRKEGSGLGLARVWVEAEMEISCKIDGEVLEVRAEAVSLEAHHLQGVEIR